MNDIEAIEYRESLRTSWVERIEMAFRRAVQGGADDPVVLLLDLSDPRARAVASAHEDQVRVREMTGKAPDPGGRPVLMLWGVPRRWALQAGATRFRGLDELIGRLEPGDGYLLVVIAGGGMSGFAMPPVVE